MNNSSTSQGIPTVSFTVLLCILGALCEGIDLQAAGLTAAGVSALFHPAPQQLGQYFGASTTGLFIGALIGGSLADRIGRKKVLVWSIALFGVFTLWTAMGGSMVELTRARFFTGLGLGGSLPNLLAMVSESSNEDRKLANLTLMYAGLPLGGALISLVELGLSVEQWRYLYVVGGVVPLLVALLMALKLPESADFVSSRQNATRATVFDVVSQGRAGKSLLLWVSFFLALLTLYLLLNWLPLLLTDSGMSKSQAATAQIGFNLGGAVATVVIGTLMTGSRRMPAVIATYIGVPVLLFALAQSTGQVMVVMGLVFLLGIVVMCSQAILYAIAPGLYPTLIRATGVGAAVAIGRIGSIVGPNLGGILKGMGYNTSQLLMSLQPVVIVGGITAIVLAAMTRSKS
jgi:MFS transporter, AAHS family, 3-hydroxyphenylpropionic acid transporter